MSRLINVIKNKNRREREDKQRRKQEITSMQIQSAYRAKLNDEFRLIDMLLEDIDVESVRIEIPKEHLSKFMRAIYGEEMAQYSIIQVDNQRFDIGRKIINF